jgi:hypothetical protein
MMKSKASIQSKERPNRAAMAWLVLILLFCLVLKFRQNRGPFFTGVDGGLYTNIAEHVRDGDGIVTDVSLYHHGYAFFPHPTAIYPIWPLVYGYLSRLAPMRITGVWIPTLGYLAALVFAYLWAGSLSLGRLFCPLGRREDPRGEPAASLAPRSKREAGEASRRLFARIVSGFNPGHILVLFLGLNGKFFTYTSLPYTEGLGYTLFFAGLWRFHKIGQTASFAHAAEMGGWLAALMLIRSQFLVVVLATLLALLWTAVRLKTPRAWFRLGLTTVVFVALLLPWFVHISSFVPNGRIKAMFRYDQARASDDLSPYRMMAASDGLNGEFKDLLLGIQVAFSPTNDSSYFSNFHGLVLALPVFLTLLIATILGSRLPRPHRDVQGLVEGQGFEGRFFLLLSAGSFASLQLMHVDLDLPWLFNQRHATILIVPLFMMWLMGVLSNRRIPATAMILIAVFTILPGFLDCWNAKADVAMAAERLRPLSRWLSKYEQGREDSVIVAGGSLPQLLAPFASRVGFHGVYWGTTERDLHTLFEKFGGELLILEDRDIRGHLVFRGVRREWFSSYFEEKTSFSGYVIFERANDADRHKRNGR